VVSTVEEWVPQTRTQPSKRQCIDTHLHLLPYQQTILQHALANQTRLNAQLKVQLVELRAQREKAAQCENDARVWLRKKLKAHPTVLPAVRPRAAKVDSDQDDHNDNDNNGTPGTGKVPDRAPKTDAQNGSRYLVDAQSGQDDHQDLDDGNGDADIAPPTATKPTLDVDTAPLQCFCGFHDYTAVITRVVELDAEMKRGQFNTLEPFSLDSAIMKSSGHELIQVSLQEQELTTSRRSINNMAQDILDSSSTTSTPTTAPNGSASTLTRSQPRTTSTRAAKRDVVTPKFPPAIFFLTHNSTFRQFARNPAQYLDLEMPSDIVDPQNTTSTTSTTSTTHNISNPSPPSSPPSHTVHFEVAELVITVPPTQPEEYFYYCLP
jgi:hypothetical protein